MRTKLGRIVGRAVLAVALVAGVGATRGTAQEPEAGARGRAGQRQQGLAQAEVERLFDSYVAMQAQDALKLSDEQFPKFLTQLKALQGTRRRNLQARRLLLADLARSLREPRQGDAALRETLRRIRELAARHADEIQAAYDAVDQVLDVGQQASFRVFEESVERRKFDLVLRARRSAIQGGAADRPRIR